MTEADMSKLKGFDNKCLRRILNIFWPNVISNRDLETSSSISSISREITKRRWKWIGHALRLDHDENPHIALTWTPDGKRRRGRPREAWRRTVTRERTKLGWNSWIAAEHRARDRSRWREDVAALCATWHEGDS
jgi:hypothetical protein